MEQGSLLEGTSSGSFKRIIMARIPIGVDLLEAIREVVKREHIQKGLILMGIGALSKATFRNLKVFPKEYPITAKDRIYFEVETAAGVGFTGRLHCAFAQRTAPCSCPFFRFHGGRRNYCHLWRTSRKGGDHPCQGGGRHRRAGRHRDGEAMGGGTENRRSVAGEQSVAFRRMRITQRGTEEVSHSI